MQGSTPRDAVQIPMISKRFLLLVVLIVVSRISGFAQETGRRKITEEPAPSGHYEVRGHPAEMVVSFNQLIGMSQLIVDGTIAGILPAVLTNEKTRHPSAETFSNVAISEILSAVDTPKPSTMFLVQPGGSVGGYVIDAPEMPLVRQGERYILFLCRDERKPAIDVSSAPRFNVIGDWSGLLKVESGKVHFLPNAVSDLHKFDGMKVDAFLMILRKQIEFVVPKDQIILSHAPF